MFKKGKKFKSEVYLVKVGGPEANRSRDSWGRKIHELKESLNASSKGYPFEDSPNTYKNRDFIVVIEEERSDIEVEMVYPHNCIMPASFIDDILSRFPPKPFYLGDLAEEYGPMMVNAAEWGWHPMLVFYPRLVSINIRMDNINHYVVLPDFIYQVWLNRKKSVGILDMNDGYEKEAKISVEFGKWISDFQKENPQLTYDFWKKEKETNSKWQSIRKEE